MKKSKDRITDSQSESNVLRRGRPSVPRERLLDAANALFAAVESPSLVTMDAIAAAAEVGKGTLFRAFGSRDELLDALWNAKLAAVREPVDSGVPPFDPGAPAAERVVALLDAITTFKLANRHLIRAREMAVTGLWQSAHYQWMHGVLRRLIEEATEEGTNDAAYAAHALLSALHIDLLEELLAAGRSREQLRQAQADFALSMIIGGTAQKR